MSKHNPRVPRKKGQPAGSKKHSDLYTDENPKGTIKGLKFATVKDAKASVSKINNSGKKHAHKIQAAVAMEQRAREMGKTSQAAVYRAYINKMKKITKKRNENVASNHSGKAAPYGSGYKKLKKRKSESVMNISKEKLKEMILEEYNNILSEKSAISLNLWIKEFERLAKKNRMKPVDFIKKHISKRKGMDNEVVKDVLKHFQKNEMMTEEQFDEAAGKKDACYYKVKARYDVWPSAYASGALVKCRKVGAKNWGNKSKKESIEEYDVENLQDYKEFVSYMKETYGTMKESQLEEAEYQGRKVKLGKPMQGDVKKFKVYVKNPKGNVVKVNFGHGGSSVKGKSMRIRKSNPDARKSFRARHNCDSPGPRHKARYWSCKKW